MAEMPGEFTISWGNDDVHERLTAEVSYRGSFVAMVTQEEGPDALRLCLFAPGDPSTPLHDLPLRDFSSALELAVDRLVQISDSPD